MLTAPVANSCGSGGSGTKELWVSTATGWVTGWMSDSVGRLGCGITAATTALATGGFTAAWNFGLPVSGNDPRANHPAKNRIAAMEAYEDTSLTPEVETSRKSECIRCVK